MEITCAEIPDLADLASLCPDGEAVGPGSSSSSSSDPAKLARPLPLLDAGPLCLTALGPSSVQRHK